MAYQPTTWQNTPSRVTPLSASFFNKMEQGIKAAHETADAAETPAGAQAKATAARTAATATAKDYTDTTAAQLEASVKTTIGREVDAKVAPAVESKVPEVLAKDATVRQAATTAVQEAAAGGGLLTPASLIGSSVQTPSLEVAQATIPAIANAKAEATTARANRNPLPRLYPVLTGDPAQDGTPSNLGGQTLTNVPSPDGRGRAWKVESAGTSLRVNLPAIVTPFSPGPVSTVTAWVYVEDPALISTIQVQVYSTAGNWVRTSNQSGSSHAAKPLARGWNSIRLDSGSSSAFANLKGQITGVNIVGGGITGPAVVYVARVVLETRPKASLIMINDWGSKAFYDIGYPAMKALGVPVTWGLRVGLLGKGTPPAHHVSVEEARQLARENGNSISFHSWDGAATSGLSADEAREITLKCMAGLQSLGLWSDGAMFRSAWVQNMAPNAAGAFPYLAVSGGWADSYKLTNWPPVDRYNIPRLGIQGRTVAQMDAHFAELKDTRRAAMFYTHGITPTGDTNHASQAEWDYFVGKVTTALSEGWLEGVTVPQLLAREALELPTAPPL